MGDDQILTASDKRRLLCIWNGIAGGSAVYLLGGRVWMAAWIGFVLIMSGLLEHEERLVLLIGWTLMILAILHEATLLIYPMLLQHKAAIVGLAG